MPEMQKSDKDFVPAALLCYFLGMLGMHRFYLGKYFTGLLMLVTFGGFGIWSIVDMVTLITGSFRDANGLPLNR